MKANELRIGNYVFSGVGGNVRVDEIRHLQNKFFAITGQELGIKLL